MKIDLIISTAGNSRKKRAINAPIRKAILFISARQMLAFTGTGPSDCAGWNGDNSVNWTRLIAKPHCPLAMKLHPHKPGL
ncbi:MAG: hypothetical protein ACLQAH_07660 [Limisphaerales bacterium]